MQDGYEQLPQVIHTFPTVTTILALFDSRTVIVKNVL